jgi:hypothetical protein
MFCTRCCAYRATRILRAAAAEPVGLTETLSYQFALCAFLIMGLAFTLFE